MKTRTPRLLIFASALFFGAAYFTVHFPDVPGADLGSYVSTFLIALPPCAALIRYLGLRRAALSLLTLSAFAYAIEMTGVATGFPYGEFHYGDALGLKAFGLVPYLLPISYAPLVIGAVAVSSGKSPVIRALSAALLLCLVDGVLDPGAAALGFWIWPEGGLYYGVPLSNYAGWLLSGTLAAALLLTTGGGRRGARPPGLLDGLIIATAFWTGVAVFSGLILPFILGTVLFAHFMRRRSTLSRSYP